MPPARTCLVCGGPVTHPRRDYCTPECAKMGHRARDAANHRAARDRDKTARLRERAAHAQEIADLDRAIADLVTGADTVLLRALLSDVLVLHAHLRDRVEPHLRDPNLPPDLTDAIRELRTQLAALHNTIRAALDQAATDS